MQRQRGVLSEPNLAEFDSPGGMLPSQHDHSSLTRRYQWQLLLEHQEEINTILASI
jgi:hypothetical protein